MDEPSLDASVRQEIEEFAGGASRFSSRNRMTDPNDSSHVRCEVAVSPTDVSPSSKLRRFQDARAELARGWHDFIIGFGTATNPFPIERRVTFMTSDLAAMRSDWGAVRADISVVWEAARLARRRAKKS